MDIDDDKQGAIAPITERSQALRDNCARYYSTKHDCRGCPITRECWTPTRQPLSHETISEHTARLNEAAERVRGKS